MRNEHDRRSPRTRRRPSRATDRDLADWRRLTRPLILDDFVDRTRDLAWSRELIDLLLDELHVSDEFDDLIGRARARAQVTYPQLVALALVLRHSWFPEDLVRIIAEPGLSPSSAQQSAECIRSPEVLDTADGRGSASHSAPSLHACTHQKGERRC
jgi:hypothetical protein